MMIMDLITAVIAVDQLVETYVLIVLADPAVGEGQAEAMEVVALEEAAGAVVEDVQGAVEVAEAAVVEEVAEVAAPEEVEVVALEDVAAAAPKTSSARMSTPDH